MSDEERFTIHYELVVIVETVMALAVHVARRDLGTKPRTPVNALAILRDRGLAMTRLMDLLGDVGEDLIRSANLWSSKGFLRRLMTSTQWLIT